MSQPTPESATRFDGLRTVIWAWVSGRVGLAVCVAFILGTLEIWGNIGSGYSAGWGDHFVLSPEGLSWAIPGAFQGDWFMEAAPQPHWFFDLLTYAGQSLGHLSATYVLFWAVGIAAFGAATAMLAFRFVPAAPWPVAIGFTLLISATPWMVGGTGSPIIAQALPAVTSANLVYLAIAALLTEVRWVAIVAAPLVAVVHVQQGAVIAIILFVSVVADTIQHRKLDWRAATALLLTIALVIFGLLLRPVASNLADFVEICNTVIPYHCAAHAWALPEQISAVGMILLAASTWFLVPRHSRLLWLCTVGLATLGYTLGFAADALSIPVLGPLAQGVNVYRLGAVILPFAVWGALTPILRPEWNRTLVIRLGLWAVGLWSFLQISAGFSPLVTKWQFGLVVCVIVGYAIVAAHRHAHRRPFVIGVAALLLGALFVFSSAVTGGLTARAPSWQFIKAQSLVQWGEAVREEVPVGSTIVASPRSEWVKLVTQRAVIVDCKDVPYGGDAWKEWNVRINDLGGFEQCVAPGPLLFNDLTADELIEISQSYDADYIAVDPKLEETISDLEAAGWERIVEPVDGSGLVILAER